MRSQGQGFTLIELLVAIAIMATLAGLLMPMITLAERESRKSATRTVMVKIDAGLRLFRMELGPYPYQSPYADLAAGLGWTNRLYYHLGTDITTDNRARVLADADAAAALYASPGCSPHAYIQADSRGGYGTAVMSNRMARERVRLAIYAGHTGVTGGVLKVPYSEWQDTVWSGHLVRRVLPTTPLLATPASAACPGMAKDYLRGELPRRYVDGDAVLDGWQHPIIYVCQVVEGMNSAPCLNSNQGSLYLNALVMGLHPLGRRTLADADAITGEPLVVDAVALPDLSNLIHSDRRRYAPRGLELEFELWSAGPDGQAAWMRDASVNRDNVALLPYDKGIP